MAGIPAFETAFEQVAEIVPSIGMRRWPEPYARVAPMVLQEQAIVAVRRAVDQARRPDLIEQTLWTLREQDPGNSIYDYLRLLPLLRQKPVLQDRLAALLSELLRAEPPRLYLTRQRESAYRTFVACGDPPRRAAMAAWRLEEYLDSYPVGHPARVPFFRADAFVELTDRLVEAADKWKKNGQAATAAEAIAVITRMWTELARDAEDPDLAVRASEKIAALLRDVADNPGRAAAQSASSLRQDWHHAAERRGVNVLPFPGEVFQVCLAADSHNHTLHALCAAILLALAEATLLIATLLLTVICLVRRPPMAELHGAGKRILFPAMVVSVSALLPALWSVSPGLNVTWLFSQPTLMHGLMWPLTLSVVLVWTGGIPKRRTWCSIALPLLAWLLALLAVMIGPWSRPEAGLPANIWRFRMMPVVCGGVSLAIAAVWMIRGLWGLRRRGPSPGWVHHALGVSTLAMTMVMLLLVLTAWMDRRADQINQDAFAAAALAPVTDVLGANWYSRYLAPAHEWAVQRCIPASQAGS